LRHKLSPESSLKAYEQITQNGQDILLHTEGPNELNIPTDTNWILIANKAHHPKKTRQILHAKNPNELSTPAFAICWKSSVSLQLVQPDHTTM
jgi:hypothetical protein